MRCRLGAALGWPFLSHPPIKRIFLWCWLTRRWGTIDVNKKKERRRKRRSWCDAQNTTSPLKPPFCASFPSTPTTASKTVENTKARDQVLEWRWKIAKIFDLSTRILLRITLRITAAAEQNMMRMVNANISQINSSRLDLKFRQEQSDVPHSQAIDRSISSQVKYQRRGQGDYIEIRIPDRQLSKRVLQARNSD